MKALRILEDLSNIDDSFIEEAAPGVPFRTIRRRRILLIALAAALALLLVSCGVASVIFGDSIQSWFAFYWSRLTGQQIATEQTAVIDHLSQEIGVSDSCGNLTVTVDSATVSEDVFFLLLRVEGIPFSARRNYRFKDVDFEIESDPAAGVGGISHYGIDFLGVDGDGTGLFLLDYQFSTNGGHKESTDPFSINLSLGNLTDLKNQKTKTVAQGQWHFSFTLDRSRLPEAVSLPDTVVPGIDLRTGETIDLMLTDIVLTNTGIRFQHISENGNIDILSHIHWISPLLTNGQRIEDGSGSGVPIHGTNLLSYSWYWPIPLNIEDIVSVRIGDTEISVPENAP